MTFQSIRTIALHLLGVSLLTFATTDWAGAQVPNADWKLYGSGTTPLSGGIFMCFFDAKGVIRQENDNFRAWTKCLEKNELDNFLTKGKGSKEAVTRKLSSEYQPPIYILEKALQNNETLA